MNRKRILAGILHLDSLRGRYIYAALGMLGMVIVVAVLSQLAVQRAAQEYNQKMMAKDYMEDAIHDFTIQHQSLKAKLPEFIIQPDDAHTKALEGAIELLESSLVQLIESEELKNSDLFHVAIYDLQQDVRTMHQAIDDIRQVRLDAEKTFPVTTIMLSLVGYNVTVLGAIDNVIAEADRPGEAAYSIEVNNLFRELRYTWARIMSEFRLLVSIRFGIFTGDWRNAFDLRFQNTELYMDGVRLIIARLEKMDNEGKLSIEAGAEFVTIRDTMNGMLKGYMDAIDVLRSDNWRQDLFLLHSRVQPAIGQVDKSIIKLHDELLEYSSGSMYELGLIAEKLSYFIWYIVAGGIIILLFGYLVFDRKVIKPIGDVTRALHMEDDSDNVVLAMHSSATEISDLFMAFTEMREQVKETNSNLESLVSERTKSLEKAQQEAVSANEAKSQFLSSMSHELRTPLNAILGFTELLIIDSEGKFDSEQIQQLRYVYNAGEHLLSLVNEVLDLERVESGKLDMVMEPVDVCNTIMGLVHMIELSAAERGISFEYGAACQEVWTVNADAVLLKQVLLNLLSNAIKYNRENGSITINVRPAGDMLELAVTDTGPGLTDQQQSQLFEPFNRLDHSNSAIEGAGLGLTIVRKFIELMGGKVSVSSKVGEGSTFRVTVPLYRSS